jgi:hypothetical protein
MSRPLRESVRAEGIGQVQQEMLDVFTVLRPPCEKTSKYQSNQQLKLDILAALGLSSVHWAAVAL